MGQHRSTRRRPKTSRRVQIVVGTVVLAVLGWFGVRLTTHLSRPACTGGTVTLNVVAAPELASVVSQAAAGLTGSRRELGTGCYAVRVSSADPAKVAGTLAGGARGGQPDVWLPDSSYWLARVHSDGVLSVPARGTSLASSPVVIALAEPVARNLGWPKSQLGWSQLLTAVQNAPAGGTLRIGIPDPARSSVGASALLAVKEATAKDGKPGPETAFALRQLAGNASPSTDDLFGKLPQSADSVSQGKSLAGFPASEQSVAAHDLTHPAVPVVPLYPQPASPSLDYPYAPRSDLAGLAREAADQFLRVLQSADVMRALNGAGFRTPRGDTAPTFPNTDGLSKDVVAPVPLPDPDRVTQAVGLWTTITLPARLLNVIDVSASMSDPVPRTNQTRLQVTLSAARQGLALFSDDSEIGLWTFSTNLDRSRDYRELVPIGPLSAQRARLDGATARIQVKQDGGTGLYDTVLAAYQRVTANWDPNRANEVTVFTDGENQDPNGINRGTLLNRLKALYNPTRPVRIIFLGLGPEVNAQELAQIAQATHGLSFVASDPTKIRDIFLQALAARPCQSSSAPGC